MKTILTKADEASVNKAAELLQAGEIVAIPTETVYGIAASAFLRRRGGQKDIRGQGPPSG